jgi:hypothetical protein
MMQKELSKAEDSFHAPVTYLLSKISDVMLGEVIEELKRISTTCADTSHWHVQVIDRDTENLMENFSGQMQMITFGGKQAREALEKVREIPIK